MGVVQGPVGDGRHRDTCGDAIGRLGQHHGGEVTAIAPAEHADACGINPGLLLQPVDSRQLVLHFRIAQLAVDHVGEAAPSAGCAAIVEGENHIALLRHVFEKVGLLGCAAGSAGPGAHHFLHGRAAVVEDENRIAPGRIEARRFEQAVVELLAIRRRERAELGFGLLVAIGRIRMLRVQAVALDPLDQAAVCLAQADLWRGFRMAEGIQIETGVLGKGGRVGAVFLADSLWRTGAAAIQRERVDLGVRHVVVIGLHVDPAVRCIHAKQLVDIPVALADRMRERAVAIVSIQMQIAAALAGPDEAAIIKKAQVAVEIDPGVAALGEQGLLFERCHVHSFQVQLLLVALLKLIAQVLAVRQPVDAGQVDVGLLTQVDPAHIAIGR